MPFGKTLTPFRQAREGVFFCVPMPKHSRHPEHDLQPLATAPGPIPVAFAIFLIEVAVFSFIAC